MRFTDPTGHYCVEYDDQGNPVRVDCGTGDDNDDPNDELGGSGDNSPIEGETGATPDPTYGDFLADQLAACPFSNISPYAIACNPGLDPFWEQFAAWFQPTYASGSKNSIFLTYGFMGAGSQGLTLVTTPDGRFVLYHDYSDFGHSAVVGPNLTLTASKGWIFGMANPLDYKDKSVGYARPSFGELTPLSGGGWITPDLKLKGLDVSISGGVQVPGVSMGATNAVPIGSGQFHGFMLVFCRAFYGGCGR